MRTGFCAACLLAVASAAVAQRAAKPSTGDGVAVLMVSDLHFEPFRDPAKTKTLAQRPAGEWKAILAAPDTADREARWAEIERLCPTRGEDTDYKLLESSLRAMRTQADGAKFAIVSGDLIAHSFACKFAAVFPQARPGDYRTFVEKTIAFVVGSLRETLPGVPVYAALGNNDSDCEDYRLDAHSEFLAVTGKTLTADLGAEERNVAEKEFAAEGDYSVSLPAPITHARLLVLDDLFLSRQYASCSGKTEAAPAAEQLAWLRAQLDEARRRKESVWVMTHIPPGVDAYATATKAANLCSGGKAKMFLSSEALAEILANYSDTIRLAIFAHTHMDEVRLLPAAGTAGVAAKIVASISPINGNKPSFTVARVDAATAGLKDYRVIAAMDKAGTAWSEEYDFAQAYGRREFTAATVGSLIAGFNADPGAKTSESQSYIHSYGTGMGARTLSLFWPEYVCALENDGASAFQKCVCGEGK